MDDVSERFQCGVTLLPLCRRVRRHRSGHGEEFFHRLNQAFAGAFVWKQAATLAELRHTAPTFRDLARSLMDEQKFEAALEKISYGVTLAPKDAEYHCLKGNILEALLRLGDAERSYAEALHHNARHALAAAAA